MDVLECIHNLLTAGILSLFCLLCYLIHKCCCNVTAAGDTKKTCFCGVHEITGQITPSNNIIAIGPNDVPFKQPVYKFLSKGAELNLPEPSASCDNCCQSPCFSDIETSSSTTSGSLLDEYIYSDALPEPDNNRYSERNNEYMTNMVMLENSKKYPRSRTRSYSYLEEPINKQPSESTRRSSAPYDVDHRSSMRRSSTPSSEPRSSLNKRLSETTRRSSVPYDVDHRSSMRRSSTPFSEPRSSLNKRSSETTRRSSAPYKVEHRSSMRRSSTPFSEHPTFTKSKRSSRSQYSEDLSLSKRSSLNDDTINIFTDKYIPTSVIDTDTYAVQEDPHTLLSNKSSIGTKSHKSKSSRKSKRTKRGPSRSSMSHATVKEYRTYDREERDVEPEQEEHCVRVKVCVKGANSASNTFNDKYCQETASGTKICIVGPSYVKQNLPGEAQMGRSGPTEPAEATKSLNPTPVNYEQFSPAFQGFAVPQQAYCAPKVVVHSCCQQGQNYSGQYCKCQNIFGQLTRNACKCLPDNNNFVGKVKRKLCRLCCNCGCHKIKNNESRSEYDGQLDDTEVVYNNSTGEYQIKPNPDNRPNENLSTGKRTSTQEKSSNKSAGSKNEEVIDEIKIKRIDCCCGESCPLKVAAAKKYRNVDGKHPPVVGGVQWLQASNSRPNSQGTADSYPEIDSGRGSSQRGTNDDCLTRLTESSITRLYEKYGCDTACSQSSSDQDVYDDPLIRLNTKYGTPGSKQDDSGHWTNHPSYCDCVSCTENPLACFIPRENVHAFSPCKKSPMSWFDQECTCDDNEEENVPPTKKFISAPDKLGNHRKWNRYADLQNLECTCHEDDILVYHTEIENEAFLETLGQDSDEQSERTDADEDSNELIDSENISVYEDCEPCPNINMGQGEKGQGRHGDKSAKKGPVKNKSDKSWFSLDCTCEEDDEEEEKNISVSSKFVSASDNLGDYKKCPSLKEPCGRIEDEPCEKTCPNREEVGGKSRSPKGGKSGSPKGGKSESSKGDTMWSLLADYFNLECHCEDDDILIFSGSKSDKKAFLSSMKQGQEGSGKRGGPTESGEVDGNCEPECPSIASGRERGGPEVSFGGDKGLEESPGTKEGRGESPAVSLGGRSGGKGSRTGSPRRSYEKAGRRDGPATKDEEDECNPKCPNTSSKKSSREQERSPGDREEREKNPTGSPGEKDFAEKRGGPPGMKIDDECNPKCPNTSNIKSPRRGKSPGGSPKGKGSREGSLAGRRSMEGSPRVNIQRSAGKRDRPAERRVLEDCDPKCTSSIKYPMRREGSSSGSPRGQRAGSPKGKGERVETPGDISGGRVRKKYGKVSGDDECDPECPDSLRNEPVGKSKGRDERGGKEEDEECEPICPPGITGDDNSTYTNTSNIKEQGLRKSPGGVSDDECDPECLSSPNKGSPRQSAGQRGSPRDYGRQGVQKRPGGIKDDECDPACPDSLKKGYVGGTGGTRGSGGRPERQGVQKRPGGIKDDEYDPKYPDSLRKGYAGRSGGTRGSGGRPERQEVRKGPGGVGDEKCDPKCPDIPSIQSARRSGEKRESTGRQGILRESGAKRGDNECEPSCEYSSTVGSTEDEDCEPVCPSINTNLTNDGQYTPEVPSSTTRMTGYNAPPCSPDFSPTGGSRSPTGGSRSPTGGSRSPGKRSLSTPGSGSRRSSPTGSRPSSRPRSPDNFIYGKERPDNRRTPSKDTSGRTTPEDGVYKYIAPGKNSKSTVSSSQTQFTELLLPDNGDYQGTMSSGQCSTLCSGIDIVKSTPGSSSTVSKRGLNKDFDNEVPKKRTKGNYSTKKDEDDSSRCSICCKYLTENTSVPDPRGRCIECCQAIRERINKNKYDKQKPSESSDRVWPSKSKSTNSFHQVESKRLVRVRARSTGPTTNLKTHSVSSKIQIISNSKSSIDKSDLDKVGVRPIVRIRIKKYNQDGEQTDETSSILRSIADCIEDVCICSKQIEEVKFQQKPKNVTDMLADLRKDPNVAWSETSDNTVTGTTTDSATMDKYHITLEETRQMCPMLSESGDLMNIPESTSPEDPQYGKFFPYKPSPCKLFPCPSDNPPSPDFPCSRPCPCGKHYCYPVPPNFDSFVRVYHQVPANYPGVCDDRERTGVCCEKKTRYAKDKSGSCNPGCFGT